MALITLARAAELIPNFPSADNAVMQDIVNASSDLIEKWCNRTFALTTYDELLDGTGHQNLLLNNYPVTKIDRIMGSPMSVVSIRNTSSFVSRANFSTTSTTLGLTSVANGLTTPRTIDLTACPTLNDVVTAVNAFSGDGWSATAMGMYSSWATSELFAPQFCSDCRWTGIGYIWHHTFGVPILQTNNDIGEVVSMTGFGRGYKRFRAIYTAGFTTIPQPVQQACASLAASVYQNREINSNLQSESLGSYSYTQATQKTWEALDIASRYALHQFKNTRVSKFKVS